MRLGRSILATTISAGGAAPPATSDALAATRLTPARGSRTETEATR